MLKVFLLTLVVLTLNLVYAGQTRAQDRAGRLGGDDCVAHVSVGGAE
jgi:hypothetical protein